MHPHNSISALSSTSLSVLFLVSAGYAGCSSDPDLSLAASSASAASGAGGGASSSGAGGAGGAEAAAPEYDLVYDPAKVHEFTVTFTSASWAALEQDRLKNKMLPADQRDFIYVPASVSFNGMKWDNVGVRYKGNSSFQVPGVKESFKLDFDEYIADQKIYGIKKMNFHNGFKDPSLLRECLSLEMYRSAGAWAPRCTYARINYDLGDGKGPQYWGLFTSVEQVDKTFLTDRFTAEYNDGNLYKPDGGGADLSVFSEATFEKKTNESAADWSDVKGLIDLLKTLNDAATAKASLEPVVNIDSVVRFMAINTILTSWDSYAGTGHNYYLYNNPKNKAATGEPYWEYIVWDANEAFGNFIPMGKSANDMISWPWDQPTAGNQKPLFAKIMLVQEWRDLLASYMKEFLKNTAVFEPASMQARAQTLHDLISSGVHEDKNYLFPTANPDLFTQNLSQNVQSGPMGMVLGIQPYIQGRADFLTGSVP